MLSEKSGAKLPRSLPIYFLPLILLATLTSCENPEGLGGTGSITGTVMEYFYNDDFSELIYQQAAADEDVYILFGEDEAPGERVRTGISGTFRVDYLYPGTYYVYYSSEDSARTPDNGWTEPMKVELGHGEDKDLGELIKLTTLKYDDGNATIYGVVKKIQYAKGSVWPNMVIDYVDYAHEHEVYLTYGDHAFYDERVRTQDNGFFEFRNLIPGNYRVFLYSEDVTRETEHKVLEYQVTITEFDQATDLGEITVEAL